LNFLDRLFLKLRKVPTARFKTYKHNLSYLYDAELWIAPVSVDLRVRRIYRHLAASPSFEGQIAGAGGTPRLSYLAFQTMEMPLDGDNTKDS
jgi:hypothetical protein